MRNWSVDFNGKNGIHHSGELNSGVIGFLYIPATLKTRLDLEAIFRAVLPGSYIKRNERKTVSFPLGTMYLFMLDDLR